MNKTALALAMLMVSSTANAQYTKTFTWTNPTENEDGSVFNPATDMLNCKVYCGRASGSYAIQDTFDGPVETGIADFTEAGDWYCVGTVSNLEGVESRYSNEVFFTLDSVPGVPSAPAILRFVEPPPPLQTTWTGLEIGTSSIGSVVVDSGTITITDQSTDIWYTADNFFYYYREVEGDVQITARVNSVVAAASWSKGSVMIRESLDPGSINILTHVTPGEGSRLQARLATDSVSQSQVVDPLAAPPHWVRLVREGNIFSGYASEDGVTWTGTVTYTAVLPERVYIGLAVTSHNDAMATTVVFDNVEIVQ